MSDEDMTRDEALELITPIVDGEATAEEEVAFYSYAQKDPSILKRLQYELQLKRLIKSKCKRAAAPPQLLEWVLQNRFETEADVDGSHTTHQSASRYQPDNSRNKTTQSQSKLPGAEIHPHPLFQFQQRTWLYTVIAAALLLIVLYGYSISWHLPFTQNGTSLTTASIDLSHQTYKHFSERAHALLNPTYSTQETDAATNWINEHLDLGIEIPDIAGANFKGVYISEFDSDYQTPLLEYETVQGEIIYLFVFNEQQLKRSDRLTRSPQAVDACSTKTNYFIENIEGKHVVSWRWDNHWYSAISNYDGRTLAQMVQPLSD